MDVKAFWESEEALKANKRDWILKRLEIREIAKHLKDGMRVLDVGCGDGETAIELASRFNIDIMGIDASQRMVELTCECSREGVIGTAHFWQLEIAKLAQISKRFDLIYTERSLINLPDWPTQQQAIRNILMLLKPGGKYLMVEHSQDGLDRLNEWRATIGLDAIPVPAHNRYFHDAEVAKFAGQMYEEQAIDADRWPEYFASTYYILSRIVNAAMAKEVGYEPSYDAFVNQLALKLPNYGSIGHGAIWIWRKP